jgi:cell division GTPase FtsZ
MRLVVVGLGQCGCRIADEFARMSQAAGRHRGLNIVTGVYAVNTDQADLTGLRTIKSDYHHRIIIGGGRTGGHGVGKINEVGAALAKWDGYKVVDAVRSGARFYETDAFLLCAGAAGGTGSGSLPIIMDILKDRFPDKPAYALIVLPFHHEESSEERSIYNTATCLKSSQSVADAVILVDNERFLKKDANLVNHMEKINQEIVRPFYDVLCCGEETKRGNIGARVLDAGDIMETLDGWTAIGCGKVELPLMKNPFERTRSFRQKGKETLRGLEAMEQAMAELSIGCNPRDAGKALYLVSAPAKEMNVAMIRELGEIMKGVAEDAVLRNGDYPKSRSDLSVTVILSQLRDLERVRRIYTGVTESATLIKKKQKEAEDKLKEMNKASDGVPSLL